LVILRLNLEVALAVQPDIAFCLFWLHDVFNKHICCCGKNQDYASTGEGL